MSGLHFAEPAFGHLFWGIAVALVVLFWLDGRGGRLLGHFVEEPMQDRVVRRNPAWRRRTRMILIGVTLTAITIALMRPQWGFEFVRSQQVGAEIMIALDVSRSMLAEDVAPNRLERAKAEIRDLLAYLEGDQVGLIAFAGRATVLCPLTPDFGFLRLVLDNVDTKSVTRGGTRLEEPIRKAVAGFGPTGDLSRVLLLITDGEDHDSFPVDAAREAAERGIRILAIGFGDEAGSEIVITDPATGARRRITDPDGRPVISRLDGELLRELAVVTEGAYIPAGTGVLDLESIFEAHIRPLMRAEGAEAGHTIQKDGFQWALLIAWIALIAAVVTGSGRGRSIGLLAVALLGMTAAPRLATADSPTATPLAGAATTTQEFDPSAPESPEPEAANEVGSQLLEIPEDPRAAFNAGLEALEALHLDDAQRLFEEARRSARGDGETRYRASFDLGWVDVERAEAQMTDDPESAREALERAADWFREAIALRPEADEPRRNLEIVLARSLALADALAGREPLTLEAELDGVIQAQRDLNRGARALVEVLQASDDPNASDALRAQFKALAVAERELLSRAGSVADHAGQELATLQATPDDPQTPEHALRVAQLQALLEHQHRARERMGQARSQFRRRRAERAHRRGAAALERLKRAREQLQDPVRILDGVITDAASLTGEARVLAAADRGLAIRSAGMATAAPDWLDTGYLGDLQSSITERTAELDLRLSGALEQAGAQSDPDQQRLLEQVATAAPHVADAHRRFEQAGEALVSGAVTQAVDHQTAALMALILAREQFLDLRGLIEVTYADEQRIRQILDPPAVEGADPTSIGEYAPALLALQERNLERAHRLANLLEEAHQAAGQPPAEETSDPSLADEQAAERKRLELADGILALTESAMRAAADALRVLGDESHANPSPSQEHVETAVRGLEHLRQLFFSIVEHLRDTARRQVEIGDETEIVGGSPIEQRTQATAPLAARQSDLASRASQLADALHEQSFADPAEWLGAEAAADPARADEAAERLTRAAEQVLTASTEMSAASDALSGEDPDFDAVRDRQDVSVEHLAEAIALLDPPRESEQKQNEQQEQEQEQEEQQQQSGEQQQPEQQQGQAEQEAESERQAEAAADPNQLLQSVRDREAERHRRRQGGRSGYEPVEKDW